MKKSYSFIVNFFSSIGKSLITTFIASALFSVVSVDKQFIRNIFKPLTLYIFLTILACYLLILAVTEYLRRRGERGIPVRLFSVIKKHLKIVSVIDELHEFQHLLSKGVKAIQNYPCTMDNFNNIGRYALTGLLTKVQQVIEMVTGADVSVNVKLFIREDSTVRNDVIPAKKTYLRTLIRIPSRLENNNVRSNKCAEREDNMKYFIGKERYIKVKNNKSQSMKKWITETITPLKERMENRGDNFFVNSAYLYILGNMEHYFISNNLVKEEKKGLYLGNCKNWKDYYKSKAVFLISPNLRSNEKVDINKPIGILIVDSHCKHIFEVRFIRKLIGYFAHRLYVFLKYYIKLLEDEKNYEIKSQS